jgi:hypothetical protein
VSGILLAATLFLHRPQRSSAQPVELGRETEFWNRNSAKGLLDRRSASGDGMFDVIIETVYRARSEFELSFLLEGKGHALLHLK